MTKHPLREKLETWVIVTIIAALVWLYAEGANVKTVTRESVQLQFVGPEGEDYAVFPAEPVRVNVSFRGSTGQIQRFQQIASKPIKVVVDPGQSGSVERWIELEDQLNLVGLGELGLTLTDVDPKVQLVDLKQLVKVSLPVRVETGDLRVSDNPPPTPDDNQITVTVTADVAADIRDSYVAARLDQVVINNTTPGVEQVHHEVPLEFPAAIDLNATWTDVERSTVKVNYTTELLDETYVIKRVPLFVNLPVSVSQQFLVRPTSDQNFLNDVEVRGPSDIIDRIRNNDPAFPVRAEIRETDPTRVELLTSVQPVIVTPPGVVPVETPSLITVSVERRRQSP